MQTYTHLKAAVLDWAGTTIDFGSRAPAAVFQEVFQRRGVEITMAQAREPMGMAKREHIAAVGNMPEVAARWEQHHGRPFTNSDIDALYAEFLPLQKAVLAAHSDLIPGAAEAVQALMDGGLRIGSTTGYTRELMESVAPAAAKQGYEPEFYLGAEDAPRGRPAPYLLFEAAKRLDVYPMWRFIKVDDTPVGIQAGRNAGTWTIGIVRTGNCVGLSETELSQLTDSERTGLLQQAEKRLLDAGAHFLADSLVDVPAIAQTIDGLLASGVRPN